MMPRGLTREDYPHIDPASEGALENIGYGAVPDVQVHAIVAGAVVALTEDIDEAQTSFDVSGASALPAAPFVAQLGSERMQVGAVSGNTLLSITRGYAGTLATSHLAGSTAFEALAEYVYLVSPEPVAAIERVLVDGVVQAEGYSAYTGQSGDEHADWPGKAVVAFATSVLAHKQRNLNAAQVAYVTERAPATRASNAVLMSQDAGHVTLSAKGQARAWVQFPAPTGVAASVSFGLTIKNLDNAMRIVAISIVEADTGVLRRRGLVHLPALGTVSEMIDAQPAGGGYALHVAMHGAGTVQVRSPYMEATVLPPPEEDSTATANAEIAINSGVLMNTTLTPKGLRRAWASYTQASAGPVVGQLHSVSLTNTGAGAAVAYVNAIAPGGALLKRQQVTLEAGASATVELSHAASSWQAATSICIQQGTVRVDGVAKTVTYLVPQSRARHSATCRAVIGARISVDAHWAVDVDGQYAGAGTVIERPDHVLRHVLVERMGMTAGQVDADAFDAAGSAHASAGYKFAFLIEEGMRPSELVDAIAGQCRSVLQFMGGKWRLDYIPDTAPAPLRSIMHSDLAGLGVGFELSYIGSSELANSIEVQLGSGSVLRAQDAQSIARYETRRRLVRLWAVRNSAMALHLAGWQLAQCASPVLLVKAPVFWEYLDLSVGDVVEIDHALALGKRFFVESVRRADAFRGVISLREFMDAA